MSVYKTLYDRRTINDFKPEKPDEKFILKAIDAARWAPNHHLTEPWRFYLIGDETKQEIITLNTNIVRESKGEEIAEKKQKKWLDIPGMLVVTSARSEDKLQEQEDFAATCCAIHNLVLTLWEDGIGVKWTTGDAIRHDDFYDIAWIDPEHETVVGLIFYGYPKATPDGMRCKAVEEILVRLP